MRQRLKPLEFATSDGTAEAVPHKTESPMLPCGSRLQPRH